jgi:hypothetical protein
MFEEHLERKTQMKQVIEIFTALLLLIGSGVAVQKVFTEARKAALTKVKQGLSSSEVLARKLTGERLDF